MKKIMMAAAAVAIAAFAADVAGSVPTAHLSASSRASEDISATPRAALSVMTYNVEGLPWPVARGRPAALAEIGQRLAALRASGRQPAIVLLQEAFIPQAKAIGALGGYRYVAFGPSAGDAPAAPTPSLRAGFDAAARWRKGEDVGKWVDSGLAILSDYPIVSTARMAFPQDACAGFDCLAAKGALLARVAVPGVARPVAVIDTHLNSRVVTGVSIDRADTAYAWQAGALRQFVAAHVDAGTDTVVGGDFNLGHDPLRLGAMGADGGVLQGASEAVATAVGRAQGAGGIGVDLDAVRRRAKDKQYFRAATGSRLALRDVVVPFRIADRGFLLSDHLGFIADYDLK